MSFENRSNELIALLRAVTERDLNCVLVGGYAVSSFSTRFSTDLDVVVAPDDKEELASFLENEGFEETDSHEKEWFYATEVVQYEKRLAPRQPIGFGLLVNGLGCRQTSAQWSFDHLSGHSTEREVSGGTSAASAPVIDGTVLVAAKLHSARETDLRDVVAIAAEIDLADVTPHLHRGDDDALREQLERGVELLERDEFRHGFRSDFGASSVSEETVREVRRYLEKQMKRIS